MALLSVGRPQGPPDAGALAATLLAASTAVAACGALALRAGAELAAGAPRGRGAGTVLHAASALPTVAIGAALLVAWSDALHLQPGIWLVAIGLSIANLPSTTLLVAESLRSRPDLWEAAMALGADAQQAAQAVFGAVQGELAGALLQVAGRSLGETALVALLAQGVSGQGMAALRAGNTLASGLWYLEMQGRIGTSDAFWSIVMLLALAALSVWLAGLASQWDRRVLGLCKTVRRWRPRT